jgi:hypothetical protein
MSENFSSRTSRQITRSRLDRDLKKHMLYICHRRDIIENFRSQPCHQSYQRSNPRKVSATTTSLKGCSHAHIRHIKPVCNRNCDLILARQISDDGNQGFISSHHCPHKPPSHSEFIYAGCRIGNCYQVTG